MLTTLNVYNATGLLLSITFGIMVPVAVFGARFAIKRRRQATLVDLRNTVEHLTGRDASFLADFEIVLQKYDLEPNSDSGGRLGETLFLLATVLIFVCVTAAGLFLLIGHANPGTPERFRLILAPFQKMPNVTLDWTEAKQNYELFTVACISYSFLGAYIWCIQYLIRRVANFDLSAISFVRLTAHILLACSIATVVRHLAPVGKGESVLVLLSFLIGFFPNAGLDYLLQRFPTLRTKRMPPGLEGLMRSMPIEIVDGIDAQASFRLAEREITDIENLATANPILICTETPYSLLQVVDWMAQAQLVLEFGPAGYLRLREAGVRTVFELEPVVTHPAATAILGVAMNGAAQAGIDMSVRLAALKANLHVMRLYEVYEVTRSIYGDRLPKLMADAPPVERQIELANSKR